MRIYKLDKKKKQKNTTRVKESLKENSILQAYFDVIVNFLSHRS